MQSERRILDEDLVRVQGEYHDPFSGKTRKSGYARVLYWGDEITVTNPAQADDPAVERVELELYNPKLGKNQSAFIKKKRKGGRFVPLRWRTGNDRFLLEVTFIDVQQGDATLVRTPDRRTLLIDGGEGKFVARMLAANFPGTGGGNPFPIDALVVTHGDADHFYGLIHLANSVKDSRPRKRFFARVRRFYHNGLVKAGRRDGKAAPLKESFGSFQDVGKSTYALDLWDDPRQAADKSDTFREWDTALSSLLANDGTVRRLVFGDDAAFDDFRPELDVRVLGPIESSVGGRPALEFLRNEKGAKSASHTINGHSIVLTMKYGDVNFMLGGDLNIDSQERLRQHLRNLPHPINLRSEILKVPHHGSHEFDPEFLALIQPVVSVVSSGDESVMKEYVHPRANLMAALGRYSRGREPLVFSTELAAFFAYRGPIQPEWHREDDTGKLALLPKNERRALFQAFERLVFGAVRVRTDGHRVLVAVESASKSIKEAYAFTVDATGQVEPQHKPSLI